MTDARVLDALGRAARRRARRRRRRSRVPPRAGRAAGDPGRRGRPPRARRAPGRGRPPARRTGEAVLATWHQLIDLGTPASTATSTSPAPPARRWCGSPRAPPPTLGVADGDAVTVGTDRGAITLPALITDMPDGVVWLPTNSPGSTVRRTLGVADRCAGPRSALEVPAS